MAHRKLASNWPIAIALAVFGTFAALCVYGIAWLVATYHGLDYKCLVDGPFRESAPFALMSEAVQVHGYFSAWPLGRACDWERADGLGFVTASSDWKATGLFLFCVAIAAAGVALLVTGDTLTSRVAAKFRQWDAR